MFIIQLLNDGSTYSKFSLFPENFPASLEISSTVSDHSATKTPPLHVNPRVRSGLALRCRNAKELPGTVLKDITVSQRPTGLDRHASVRKVALRENWAKSHCHLGVRSFGSRLGVDGAFSRTPHL